MPLTEDNSQISTKNPMTANDSSKYKTESKKKRKIIKGFHYRISSLSQKQLKSLSEDKPMGNNKMDQKTISPSSTIMRIKSCKSHRHCLFENSIIKYEAIKPRPICLVGYKDEYKKYMQIGRASGRERVSSPV